MSITATLPLPLALTAPQPVEGPCSLEELHYREYTSVYTKYNPETQVRETSDGVPASPRMDTDRLQTVSVCCETCDYGADDDDDCGCGY